MNKKWSSEISRRMFLSSGATLTASGLLNDREGETSHSLVNIPCIPENRRWQYKRYGNAFIGLLVDGQVDEAIACIEASFEIWPNDPELYFCLAVAYSKKEVWDLAAGYVQRALDNGFPPGRFIAGPRSLMGNLHEHPILKQILNQNQLVHGPLLGQVTDRSAAFWLRTALAYPVQVTLFHASGDIVSQVKGETTAERDYTTVLSVEGLSPDTEYRYSLDINGSTNPETWSFRTFPASGKPAQFEIGFGGCAGYTPWQEYMWRTIAAHQFPLFLLTGDNIYIDAPDKPEVNEYCYYRRQSRPEFRTLTGSTSIAAIWDDHDFGTNDSWGGAAIDAFPWKQDVFKTFKQNWNNPSYGMEPEHPGCWFALSIADVDLFMLDDRFYRTDPRGTTPATMLGPIQKSWLIDRLRQSTATFKLIVTSVPWAYGVKPGSLDPWQGYKEERDALFDTFKANQINGIVLLSGDRHRADLWRIDREGTYPLYDFENARLTNLHTHDTLGGALFGYNEKCTFGRLRFDTTRSDPTITYDIMTIDNEEVYSITLKQSEISD